MTIAEEQTETKQPIDVKRAVRTAMAYVNDLFEQENVADIALEEVEHGADGDWYITIGLTRPVSVSRNLPSSSLASVMQEMRNPRVEREYKIIHVNKAGEPVSMKIRNP